jgi:disulfide bond formation protein DsbB
MDLEAVQLFTSLLSVFALFGSLILLMMRIVMNRVAWFGAVIESFALAGLWVAALVATVATMGSLYFSEVAGYVPCQLCWYQRIAMYPLAVILLIAALRRDRNAVWYVLPIAAVGAGIAAWHRLVELRPQLESTSCSAVGPSCAATWFERFGFVTLAFMAFSGFISIMILSLISSIWAPRSHSEDADSSTVLSSSTPRPENQ